MQRRRILFLHCGLWWYDRTRHKFTVKSIQWRNYIHIYVRVMWLVRAYHTKQVFTFICTSLVQLKCYKFPKIYINTWIVEDLFKFYWPTSCWEAYKLKHVYTIVINIINTLHSNGYTYKMVKKNVCVVLV